MPLLSLLGPVMVPMRTSMDLSPAASGDAAPGAGCAEAAIANIATIIAPRIAIGNAFTRLPGLPGSIPCRSIVRAERIRSRPERRLHGDARGGVCGSLEAGGVRRRSQG